MVKSQGQGFPWPWAGLIRPCGSFGSRVAPGAQAQPARVVPQRILDANNRPLILDELIDGELIHGELIDGCQVFR